MTTASISTSMPLHQTMGRTLRILFVTIAVVVLLTVAFVVGRVTAGSSSAPAITPAVSTHLLASNDTGVCGQVGHLRQC
jgi:hypothetical protein